MFLEQFTTGGKVGRTSCSPNPELKLQGSLCFYESKLSNNIPSEVKDFYSLVVFKTRILEL